MEKLTRGDLLSLEQYAGQRAKFRAEVMAHKQDRRLSLDAHATLYFEDRRTIHYQIQEMLRIERIFEAAAIEEELAAYNPLIPDGRNWKATFMLEYEDEAVRKVELSRLIGIEDMVWVRVQGFDAVRAIADEDMEREDEDKTSSVHFLRFELSDAMVSALKGGAALGAGIDHPNYRLAVEPVAEKTRLALIRDLE